MRWTICWRPWRTAGRRRSARPRCTRASEGRPGHRVERHADPRRDRRVRRHDEHRPGRHLAAPRPDALRPASRLRARAGGRAHDRGGGPRGARGDRRRRVPPHRDVLDRRGRSTAGDGGAPAAGDAARPSASAVGPARGEGAAGQAWAPVGSASGRVRFTLAIPALREGKESSWRCSRWRRSTGSRATRTCVARRSAWGTSSRSSSTGIAEDARRRAILQRRVRLHRPAGHLRRRRRAQPGDGAHLRTTTRRAGRRAVRWISSRAPTSPPRPGWIATSTRGGLPLGRHGVPGRVPRRDDRSRGRGGHTSCTCAT